MDGYATYPSLRNRVMFVTGGKSRVQCTSGHKRQMMTALSLLPAAASPRSSPSSPSAFVAPRPATRSGLLTL